MKKTRLLILITIMFFFWPGLCFANYLGCDPYAVGEVDHFLVSVDGLTPVTVPYSLHSSGAAIVYDLTGLDLTVPHAFEIWAVNSQGMKSDYDSAVAGDQPVPFDLNAKPSSGNLSTIRIL